MMIDDVASWLVSNTTFTVGGTTGTLAKAIMLDSHPNAISVLFETPGGSPEHAFSSSTGRAEVVYESPNLQILTRSTSYTGARTAAEKLFVQLDGAAGVTMGSVSYLDVAAVQSPFDIGRDNQERYLVSCNYRIKKVVG